MVPSEHTRGDESEWVGRFLGDLFRALDDAEIRWLILRNQDRLDRIGHDLDIIVHPRDASRLEAVVRRAVVDGGYFLLRVRRGIEHLAFDVSHRALRGRLLLHVDFQTRVAYRGRTLIDADDVFAHRRRAENGAWVLSPGMEAYALILHAALHKGALKEAYALRLAAIEEAAPGALLHVATERLGEDLGRRVAGVRTEEDLLRIRRPLARAVDTKYPSNVWRRPWFTVSSGAAMSYRRMRPTGIFVVFLGPDGSGKSTTVEMLTEILTDPSGIVPIHRVYLGSGRPILPTRKLRRKMIAARLGERKRTVRDVRPRRLRGAIHVMVDEIVRYWMHVRPRVSPHGIVLADRYAYDVLRINNPHVRSRWFRRIATAFIPTPDITFFLEGDPETISARKQELTVAETIRQQRAYRELEAFVPTFRPVDLTVRDEAALRRVALQILDVFAARNGGMPVGDPATGEGR